MFAEREEGRAEALLAQHGAFVAAVAALYGRHAKERHRLALEIRAELERRGGDGVATCRIAFNVAMAQARAGAGRARPDAGPDGDLELDPRAEDAERVLALQGALERLGELDRALLACRLEELGARETAAVLGLDEALAAAKVRALERRVLRALNLEGAGAQGELERAWREFAWRSAAVLRESGHAAPAAARPLVEPALEVAGASAAALLLGRFLVQNLDTVRFAVPAAVLLAVLLAGLASSAARCVGLARIDRAAPVLAVQLRLAALAVARERMLQAALLVAPLLWTPLAIVLGRAWLGLDVYGERGATFVALNVAFALALIPLAVQGARAAADRLAHAPPWQRLADRIAGHALARALAERDALARYADGA